VKEICGKQGKLQSLVDEEAIKLLESFNWSGNVRELHNVVERLVILSGNEITVDDVKHFVKPTMLN
jgi:DNA-binding NtrC family response regulator